MTWRRVADIVGGGNSDILNNIEMGWGLVALAQ